MGETASTPDGPVTVSDPGTAAAITGEYNPRPTWRYPVVLGERGRQFLTVAVRGAPAEATLADRLTSFRALVDGTRYTAGLTEAVRHGVIDRIEPGDVAVPLPVDVDPDEVRIEYTGDGDTTTAAWRVGEPVRTWLSRPPRFRIRSFDVPDSIAVSREDYGATFEVGLRAENVGDRTDELPAIVRFPTGEGVYDLFPTASLTPTIEPDSTATVRRQVSPVGLPREGSHPIHLDSVEETSVSVEFVGK